MTEFEVFKSALEREGYTVYIREWITADNEITTLLEIMDIDFWFVNGSLDEVNNIK